MADDALVLDVGSGDKPSWRADVLLDRYAGAEYAGQRSGRRGARITRPLFDADAADMPFADNAFDYAICSHVLEHVPDPVAVASELARVARAGYVEVPEAASAKIVDFPSHLWWCRLDEDTDPATLVFTAKQRRYFDEEVQTYLEASGLEKRVEALLHSRFEHTIIQLPWSGVLRVRAEGHLDPEFAADAIRAEGHPKTLETLMTQVLTTMWTWRRRRRIGDRQIPYDRVVKPELRKGNGTLLEKRVYRLE